MREVELEYREKMETMFNLVKVSQPAILLEWVTVDEVIISDYEVTVLVESQKRLQKNAFYWNESDLKMFFISPLLVLADYDQPDYQIFTDRKLATKVGQTEVGSIVDFLIAKGKSKPKQPYFCLHEYKWSHRNSPEPVTQLLLAMACAQAQNNNPQQPIYGVVVDKQLWYFMTLLGQEYGVSEPYSVARGDDIFTIFKILRRVKVLIKSYL